MHVAYHENFKLFESFIGRYDCTASVRLALAVAVAYQHFGKNVEAKAWWEKAKAAGAKELDASGLDRPFVKDGAIQGRILLNSKPLANTQVALLGYGNSAKKIIEDFQVTQIGLGRTLVAVARTAKDGTFRFTALGNGQYLLAIMTGQDTIPSFIQSGKIRARNVPAVVELGPVTKRELGTIAMTTEQ